MTTLAFTACDGGGEPRDAGPRDASVADGSLPPAPTLSGYRFGAEADPAELALDLPGSLAALHDRGITFISVEVFNLDGQTIFESPSLLAAGFASDEEYPPIFAELLTEAARAGIQVVVMLEGIAHMLGGDFPFVDRIDTSLFTTDYVETLISELAAEARAAGASLAVSEEAFEPDFVQAIRDATAREGVEYLHFFEEPGCRPDVTVSEDYSYYPRDARNDPADQAYLASLQEIGSYYGQLGHLPLMFGTARGCETPTGVTTSGGWGLGPRTHVDIALMRAVQFGPHLFQFVVGEGVTSGPTFPEEVDHVAGFDFADTLLPLLTELSRRDDDPPKPLADLVIEEPPASASDDVLDLFLNARISNASAITGALLAAGYDLVVTDTPIAGADRYYVLAPGAILGEAFDLSTASRDLADGSAPVTYQLAGTLPDLPAWNHVADALGIRGSAAVGNEDRTSHFDPIPERVSYDFPSGRADVRWGGVSLEVWDLAEAGRVSFGHYVQLIDPSRADGALLTGMTAADGDGVFDDETVLLLARGHLSFVNGSYLHMEAASILANLMAPAPVYRSLSYGYLTRGASRSVFFAPYATEIDLDLLGGTRVTELDADGNRLPSSGVTLEGTHLFGHVPRFHLVVVDSP